MFDFKINHASTILIALYLGVFFGFNPQAAHSQGGQTRHLPHTWERPIGFIHTSGYAPTPKGFLDFCTRHPDDCAQTQITPPLKLNTARMRELNVTNMDINDTYQFNTDLPGRDIWQYPTDGFADCEDYALTKRKHLMDLGWPPSSLLITIVEKKAETVPAWRIHAVLTVRTAQGDYILDNEIRPAVPWHTASRLYDFIMMQSPENPKLWTYVN